MPHRIRCRCGAVRGEVCETQRAVRAICYCRDCRAYAIHLGQADAVLDAHGGTEVVATAADRVELVGVDRLACVSLTPRGLLRWYAACCGTPIANSPRDWRIPYVGLLHTALAKPLELSFPRLQMRVYSAHAKGHPPPVPARQWFAFAALAPALAWARVSGGYRRTPFFTRSGSPIAEPRVLTRDEHEHAKQLA